MQFKTIYELTPEQQEDLYIDERTLEDDYSFFEGDPDWVDHERGRTYFSCIPRLDICVVSDHEADQYISDFNNGVDFESLEDQTWDSFDSLDCVKIAYRGGAGYVYNLYKIKD